MSNPSLSGDTTVISVPGRSPMTKRKRVFRGSALIFGLLLVALWSVSSWAEWLNPRLYPAPWDVVAALPRQLSSPTFWMSFGNTVITWLMSVGIVALLGTFFGLLIGSSRLVHQLTRLVIEFLRPIPSVAILPLILLLLGPTEETKIILAVYAGFWPMLVQTIYGIRSVDPVLLDTARAFSVSRLQVARRVVIPSAMPYLATGLRLSSALTLVLTVTVEIIIGVQGLGREIFIAQSSAAVSDMYLLIAISGFLGLAVNEAFRLIESRLLSWHQSQREEGRAL